MLRCCTVCLVALQGWSLGHAFSQAAPGLLPSCLGLELIIVVSTVLAVTDLTTTSYQLVAFASFVARPTGGEVVLVSAYGGGAGRRSEPPAKESEAYPLALVEKRMRQEGRLLERQRQWFADRGVRCRAELYEDGLWSEFVVQSALRAQADLIMVGFQLLMGSSDLPVSEVRRMADEAPCPVSVVRLPSVSGFEGKTILERS